MKPIDITRAAPLSGISTVMMGEKRDVPIYTTSSQRLAAPHKGINIIDGKKIVVK